MMILNNFDFQKKLSFIICLFLFCFANSFAQPVNLGFETGDLTGWTLQEGGNQDSYSMIINNIHASTEYSVMLPSAIETNSVPITMASPFGGNYARIGRVEYGGTTYKLSQTFTVDASSSSLAFGYAIVMDNGGHDCKEQNFFNFSLKDANGNVIPSNSNNQSVLAGTLCLNTSGGDPNYSTYTRFSYKNWSNLSYDLSSYMGTTVTVELLVAGCNMDLTGHAGYAYFDASFCGNNPAPGYVTINGNPYALPQNNTTIDLCNSSNHIIWAPVGATSFSWTGGAINGLTTQSVSITQPGVYHLTCNKPYACSNTTEVTFIVGPPSNLSVTNLSTISCPGAAVTLSVTGASSYTWSSVSGTTQNMIINSSTYDVTPQVNSVYNVIGKDVNGCVSSKNYTVSVLAAPSLSVVPSAPLCSGATVKLTASGADTYSWNGGATSNTISVVPTLTQTPYTVTGKLLSTGCTTASTYYVLADTLYVIIDKNKICIGRSTIATGKGALNYNWSTGATTNTISVTPTVTTTYTVSGLTSSCGLVESVITITVVPLPTIVVTPPTIPDCPRNYFLSASGASTYTWSSGITNNTNVYLNSTSSYTITGADVNGCKNTTTATYSVLPIATLTVTANPTLLCAGQSATLTALGASTYTWNTGVISSSIVVTPTVNTFYSVNGTNPNGCISPGYAPGITVSAAAPSFSFASNSYSFCPNTVGNNIPIQGPNTYTYSCSQPSVVIAQSSSPYFQIQTFVPTQTIFTITATNGCGSVSNTVTVDPLPLPNMSITGPTITCDATPITYTVGGVVYVNANPGNISVAASTIMVSPTVNTTYTITGRGANNCFDTQTINVMVNTGVTVPSNSYTICSGTPQTLSANGASSYTWSTGANTQSIIVTPSVSTIYSVTGVSSNGCTATKTISVVVIQSPSFTVNSGSVCAGNFFVMNPIGAIGNLYYYSSGSASVIPTSNASYTVTAYNSSSCVVSAVSSVTVNPIPTITVNSGTICSGQTFSMMPGGGTNYVYSNGSNIVSPSGNTSYTVTGADANGCINTAVSNVFVNAGTPPNLSVNSGTICSGDNFTITPSGASSYSYSSGSAIVTPTATTEYTVTTNSGCSGTYSITSLVTVNQPPTITVNSGTVCSGDSFTIVPNGANTYTYSSGSNVVVPANNMTVTVTGTDSNGCQANFGAISSISVNALPTITVASSAATVCENTSIDLTAGGADTYVWSTGANTQSLTLIPTANATYTVTGIDQNNCSSTQTVSIVVDNTCQDVWPGDANSDGVANNLDVLELGLHYTQTGTPRASISNTWQSYFSNNWSGTIT
ncbi:MAG: hypothetical protein HY062_19125, partial [Bacteroidetes bacterium]|nr:hypothetical protein [Bacteroidota bacterium]